MSGVSDLLAGVDSLRTGFKDYAAGETAQYNRQVEANTKASNRKLGTELLQDASVDADPKTRFAARALQEGTLDSKEAMSGFRDMSPEQQMMMLSARAIQTNDPVLFDKLGQMYDYYGKIHKVKAYMESYGKTTGYIAGGGLSISGAGKGGGGGGGSGTGQLSNMVVSKDGLEIPVINALNKAGLKYKDGKPMTFKAGDIPANMIMNASPEDAQTLAQAMVKVTRDVLSQRPEFSNPLTANVLDAASVSIANEAFGSGFETTFRGRKKVTQDHRGNDVVEYSGATSPTFPVDSRIYYYVNTPTITGGGVQPAKFGSKQATPASDSLYDSFNTDVLGTEVNLPKKVKMSPSPWGKDVKE